MERAYSSSGSLFGIFDKEVSGVIYMESSSSDLCQFRLWHRLPRGYRYSRRYAPTFLELAGADIPADIQGVSLAPLLRGEHPERWRDALYYHFYEFPGEHCVKRHCGIRTERYKLIHFYNDIDVWELYDLDEDPAEMHNIYGKAGTEAVTADLKERLAALQQQYDDPVRFGPEHDKDEE